MSKERRYQEHEIRQILDLAIDQDDAPARTLPAVDGLTLVQLQEVGREVGLRADRIEQAVATFEGRGESVPRDTTFGLPTSVGRIISLPRNPSEREWELLIAELRTTFGGMGVVTSHGGLREWSHGRVQVFLEPTETGHRLRLTDQNAAVGGIVLGAVVMAFALVIQLVLLGKEDPGLKFAVPAFLSLLGGTLLAGSALSLPKWARKQETRMQHITSYALSVLAPRSSDEPK